MWHVRGVASFVLSVRMVENPRLSKSFLLSAGPCPCTAAWARLTSRVPCKASRSSPKSRARAHPAGACCDLKRSKLLIIYLPGKRQNNSSVEAIKCIIMISGRVAAGVPARCVPAGAAQTSPSCSTSPAAQTRLTAYPSSRILNQFDDIFRQMDGGEAGRRPGTTPYNATQRHGRAMGKVRACPARLQ